MTTREEERAVRLSAHEAETLRAWTDCEIGYGFGFKFVAENCNTPRHLIRRTVRALARKGMLEYRRSLYSEDDGTMGAGYVLTEAGTEFIN